ncbi:ATP-grasp domain-containing protein [Streptomyces phaeochromogenes]
MADPQQVIVVGGGPGLCDRIRLTGTDITMVDTPAGYDKALVSVAKRTVLSEYDDPSLIPLLRAIHRDTPFSAVLSLTELGLMPAARIAEELGIPGLSTETVGRTRDKLTMRTWLRDKAFSAVPCSIVENSADIKDFATEHGYPVIVKPRHGKGSEHVSCFGRADDVVMPPAITDDYIAEPFFPGVECSVEAFSCAGEHHVIAITGKVTQDDDPVNPFVEIGHAVPASIGQETAAGIAEYVSAFLDVMGITDGCSHTEVRLTASGPEVIETHTRVGGGSIPTLVRQTTGYDLLDLLVEWSLERIRPRKPASAVAGGAAIRYFTPPPGRVLSISGVQRWQGLPGVLKLHLPLKPGDRVSPIRDSRTRVGYVVATSSNTEQAIDLCRQVASGIRIDIG